jgi:osmotically inducible protein OsmC
MAVSKATAQWTGTLKEGKGSVKGTAFEAPFTFASRFESNGVGTTPEELIGAAQAGCFSKFLAAQLEKAGHPATRNETRATVHLEAGPTITKIELATTAQVPGADAALFDEKVLFSKQNCPVSKALASVAELVVNAKLV